MSDVHPDYLSRLFRETAEAKAKIEEIAIETRDAIIVMGRQIRAELDLLPNTLLETLGITTEIVVRSAGAIQEDVDGLPIKHLPLMDVSGFERRADAAALYLDAFHGRPERLLGVQIQSTPGVMVSACSQLERLDEWLKPLLGVAVRDGRARLVYQRASRGDIETGLGPDAKTIVLMFIQELHAVLRLGKRFNRATDLP